MTIVEILHKSLMITAFVAVMMLLVEYFNVRSRGLLMSAINGSRRRQYLLAAVFGAIPGCLGVYAVVALYTHRKISLGALVAAMVATSGDEAFVMLAVIPRTAVLMTLGLAVIGIVAGWITDKLVPNNWLSSMNSCCELKHHEGEECRCFPRGEILAQWRKPSPYRATLVIGLILVAFGLVTGHIGPAVWGWKRVTLLLVMGIGVFISMTVPEHFLEEHLWRHVAVKHVPRIFAWTLAVLASLVALDLFVNMSSFVSSNPWQTLSVSAVIGIIPESGPHLVFVTMFADGKIPLSILVTSSIVQDGHGMLPLLSASKRAFVAVKLINLIVGIGVGGAMLALGN